MPDISIRAATRDDASFLLPLIDTAGEGLPMHVWGKMAAPGQDAWQFGLAQVQSEAARVSYRHAWIAERAGVPAACLFAYRQPDTPAPPDADTPPIFAPIEALERIAAGTGYVHVLATLPQFRGHGIGTRLLQFAERYQGPRGMSLIVADSNTAARRLYAAQGYAEADRRAIVTNGWTGGGTDWVLMIRR
jgi:GNAT superfamily N-acetyltransferase